MFDTFINRLEINGTLATITALRISSGRSTEPIGSDLPVIKDANGRPFIPGASFKGALRARLESFLRGIDPALAADPTGDGAISQQRLEALKNEVEAELKQLPESERAGQRDRRLSTKVFAETDLASLLFGSSQVAAKLQLRDLRVKPDTWFGQYQERDGVAIDRDTETASTGKLYDFQVVPPEVEFEFCAIVENAKPHELGLLMFGLQQFEQQQIPLGGGRSRGLGVVELSLETIRWFDARPDSGEHKPDPQKVMHYLEELLAGRDAYEDATELRTQWQDAFVGYLRQNYLPQSA